MAAVISVSQEVRNQVQDLVYETCLLLNEEKWTEFLELCDESDFRYVVGNYSPEIGKDQYWLDLDFGGMKHLVEMLPVHNSDHAKLTRHPTMLKVLKSPNDAFATAITGMTIYRTHEDGGYAHLEGGSTSLYLVGRYIDRVSLTKGQAKLLERTVWLDTRQLDIGSHYPF